MSRRQLSLIKRKLRILSVIVLKQRTREQEDKPDHDHDHVHDHDPLRHLHSRVDMDDILHKHHVADFAPFNFHIIIFLVLAAQDYH